MKMKFWSVLAAMISTGLLAQQATNTAPIETPAAAPPVTTGSAPVMQMDMSMTNMPGTNAATKPKKSTRKTAKAPAKRAPFVELKTVPLVPGPAVVAVTPGSRVMVRSKASISADIITRMTNGEPVSVIEEVHLTHSGADEPSAWAKVALPEKAHVWVKHSYIDATAKTVIPKKLNLRSGPGENYGVVGSLQRGDSVKEVETKGDWTQIETPPGSYAFMAAQYLSQAPAVIASAAAGQPATNVATEAVPTTTVGTEPTLATAPTNTPAIEGTTESNLVASATEPTASMTNEVAETNVVEEPPPPRIVQHEGFVRGTFSIQAPTHYELINPDNHKVINYLFTPAADLDLSRYKGLRVIVTGEEGLDERWRNTPVITIQRLQVVD